jgi:Ras-related protein Rab-33B
MATWLHEYGRFSDAVDVPRILIGNKCDLGHLRTVSSNAARKFADSYDMPLWEISTKNDDELQTIDSIFLTVAHKLVKEKPIMKNSGMGEVIDADGKKRRGSSKRKSKRIKLIETSSHNKKKCCESN